MSVRIGINGFGRIGRLVARAIFESGRDDVALAAVNDPGINNVHLFKYDSVHGKAPFAIERIDEHDMLVSGQHIPRLRDRDPLKLDWSQHNVDIVLDCTGKFRDYDSASMHLKSGAKKVLISAPATNEDLTVVYGVNHHKIRRDHIIVSNASCTTNCLAPVAYVLHNAIGIERGFMTTIHAYTGDQSTVDASHKDPHRARAAGINLIPTSTGAAKAVGKVLPELDGKLDGVSVRVPTPNVSLVDLTFDAKRNVTVNSVNAAIVEAADGELEGILRYYDEPLVSGDFNHDPHSAIFNLNGTTVVDNRFVRVMAWYDNEWAFSCRMLDTAVQMHKAGYE